MSLAHVDLWRASRCAAEQAKHNVTVEDCSKIDTALQARLAHPLIAQRALHFIGRYVFAKDEGDETGAQAVLAEVSPSEAQAISGAV